VLQLSDYNYRIRVIAALNENQNNFGQICIQNGF
jgi:hypothetical protein